ncbi:MAG: cysteine desulfurase NifS [Omnitrophica bacterium RIFCSPLOWO2_12_FULL_44_17]|uniref:cysteine desulfurase n=1 Tax=Candidatus Danuiimicrobium aquiferis TaxID=1801832 RepID=A0A1G1L324_9BACT|nr:MAG: cysteine desulfurase NifS [Omnitrophica bacterium RIFCSPHIGHO2_02_FULL_45_28]OGW92438.1 MAG: cysteine desulfurase NifS [Omnitrophica bacterium RIFCSPHIGHO2_12_FULL_44_12]OGW99527.1 MAG: cysteine desulfurase NifS [Omnitrophica bacterium RIFCSPLOWO2_12_FULL_44_17]OGX02699.1 MAG: cysteine desulfurase NifS [Omnitrophica bacterium RIFCSPLOWO2_02_FULL_44_11]
MTKRLVYLDHNATTPIHPEVKRAMSEAMDLFGNPSSLHEFGRKAKSLIEKARETVAEFISADSEEIIFVGSGSEANNTVLSMLACPSSRCMCTHKRAVGIITTTIEHPCVLEAAKCLEDRGFSVDYLKVDQTGKVDLDQLKKTVTEKTGIVSVMMANNEIGTIQDMKTIEKIIHEQGAMFHTDAVQAVGKIPVNVRELNADFLTISAHKVYGPKGVGALYIKNGISFCPMIRGGHQERGRRAGTENTIGIVGLGKAIELRKIEMTDEEKRLLGLKAILRKGLEEKIPDIHFNGHPTDCLAGTLSVSFEGAEGEAILLYLDLEGIAVSTGSACASGSLDPSHVLLATGMSAERAHGTIRLSMGRQTTEEEIRYVLDVFPKVIQKVRDMSTAYSRRKS